MSNIPHSAIFQSVDNYLKVAQEVTKDEFFAIICSSGVSFNCHYHLEYACFSCCETRMYIGLIDCVAEKYYVSKSLDKEDIALAVRQPFLHFKLEISDDNN